VKVIDQILPLVWDTAFRMREKDYEELSCIFEGKSRKELADILAVQYAPHPTIKLYALDDGTPTVVMGWTMARPGTAQIGMFATDDFGRIKAAVSKHIVRHFFDDINTYNIHRMECFSLGTHTEAHEWIEWLGLKKEAEIPGYGKNGEMFVSFAWTRGPDATQVKWRRGGELR
jgi:hypothetical protein